MEQIGHIPKEKTEKAPHYPELARRLDTLMRYSNRILTRWLVGKEGRKEMLAEAKSIAHTGGVEIDFGGYKDRAEGRYRLELKEDEATRIFDAMEEYLKNPYHYDTAADTMGEDIEDLMSGTGPTERYIFIPQSTES